MDVQEYIGYVVSEGERLAAVADNIELSAEIPPCPGWDVRELLRHTGLIHLWAAGHLAFPHQLPDDVDLPELAPLWPELASAWPEDNELVDWYRRTHANLVDVLRQAPEDLDCWTFLPAPSAPAMWSRRQASEIAIHRVDAEMAAGIDSEFEAIFAAEMLDELLSGFTPGPRSTPLDVDGTKVIGVHAQDTDDRWFVTLTRDEMATSRSGLAADLTVTGTAAELYLLFWNRTADSTVAMDGETELMELWRGSCRIRWG
jgi:uncharacterized protein (TIGR03083 family)